MKTCPHCHAPNREEARFCSACGSRLEPSAAEAPTADAQAILSTKPAASLSATGEEIATGGRPEPDFTSSVSPSPAAPAATALTLTCASCGGTIRYCPCCGAPLEVL